MYIFRDSIPLTHLDLTLLINLRFCASRWRCILMRRQSIYMFDKVRPLYVNTETKISQVIRLYISFIHTIATICKKFILNTSILLLHIANPNFILLVFDVTNDINKPNKSRRTFDYFTNNITGSWFLKLVYIVNRGNGISVIKGPAVLVCLILKSSAITARFFYWQSFLNSFIINFKLDQSRFRIQVRFVAKFHARKFYIMDRAIMT